MWFLFLTPVANPVNRFAGGIPARSLMHCVFFFGLTHLCLTGLKKQLKYEYLRSKAYFVVLIFTIVNIVLSETIIVVAGMSVGITYWNILFDILGAIFGNLSFRLLYRSCY